MGGVRLLKPTFKFYYKTYNCFADALHENELCRVLMVNENREKGNNFMSSGYQFPTFVEFVIKYKAIVAEEYGPNLAPSLQFTLIETMMTRAKVIDDTNEFCRLLRNDSLFQSFATLMDVPMWTESFKKDHLKQLYQANRDYVSVKFLFQVWKFNSSTVLGIPIHF